jgi:ubiquinone/menaquinone biosynthesis C-methylase UbiE
MHKRHPPPAESAYRPFPNEGGRNWRQEHLEIPLMLRALKVPRGGRVLEVGCGRGTALGPLSRRLVPQYLVGVDIDVALLKVAKQSGVRADLVVADVHQLPFPTGDFDVVIDFGTCFHVARPEAALLEIARVIALGGIFVTEMKLSQLLSHPVRTRGRFLPWTAVSLLTPLRRALLWESRRRVSP